jgi:hypothetical protein
MKNNSASQPRSTTGSLRNGTCKLRDASAVGGYSSSAAPTPAAISACPRNFSRLLRPLEFFRRIFLKSSTKPSAPSNSVGASTSHRKWLSGRHQHSAPAVSENRISRPPIVGVPFLLPCKSASSRTSSRPRIGWPSFSRVSARITAGPTHSVNPNVHSAAISARKVTYSNIRSGPKASFQ